MKNYCLVVALSVTLIGCSSFSTENRIQSDPAWASGQLENGLTYHSTEIMKNQYRFDLWCMQVRSKKPNNRKLRPLCRAYGV